MSSVVRSQKIKKSGPFLLPVTPQYPYFSHLLAHALVEIKELPDFSDDTKIAVMSDFSGEHKGARFNTYSFLVMAYNKVGPFETKVRAMRQKYGILEPYSEFAFKNLTYGPRSRALPEFLNLVDNFIHGAVVTVAVEKSIGTVFGAEKHQSHAFIEKQLAEMDLGEWDGETAEKMLRVCHSIAAVIGLTTQGNERLLWYSDNDAINEDARTRGFVHTQNIFNRILGMYSSKNAFEIVGFGKSFEGKSHFDDLLSIPDFAAGVVQDLLQAHATGNDQISGGREKEALIRWIATQGRFLCKIAIQISRLPNGEVGSGLVQITPK